MRPRGLQLDIPVQTGPTDISDSGTWNVTDSVVITKKGLRIEGVRSSQDKVDGIGIEISADDLIAIRPLGKGQFGTVELVRHREKGILFARKCINMPTQVAERQMIAREIKALASVKSAYCVRFYTGYIHETNLMIVMEYMDAGTVHDLAKLSPNMKVPEQVVQCIAVDVMKGLTYLHSRMSMIHRDIKPVNLLLNREGMCKISDFGLAVRLEGTVGGRETFVGTAPYMSPERIQGTTYGTASDIWSVGVTLMELLIGRHPYLKRTRDNGAGDESGSARFFVLMQAVSEMEPPLLADEGDFSEEACHFIKCCMRKDPGKRFSAAQMLKHKWLAPFVDDGVARRRIISQYIASCMAKA